ncbi:MAG: sensor histidine kinase [Solirubrobacterales bacterium]
MPNVTAADAGEAEPTQDAAALEARVAKLEAEVDTMRETHRETAEVYLNGLSRAVTPQAIFLSMTEMLRRQLVGAGIASEDSATWLVLFENPLELPVGTAIGNPADDLVQRARRQLLENPSAVVMADGAGQDFVVIPVPSTIGEPLITGVVGIAAKSDSEIPADLAATLQMIAMSATMHLDRIAHITESVRNTQYAEAAARAQLELTEQRERGEALEVAVEAVRGCDDLSGVVAVDLTGDHPTRIAGFGDLRDDVAFATLNDSTGGNGGVPFGISVVPVAIDGVQEAALVLQSISGINAMEDEMLGSIVAAVVGSVVRFRAAGTIESLRRSATRRLVEAQERERSMVAADIHDGVLQQLGATAIRLELAQARVEQSDFATAREIIEDGAKEIRSCARELRALLMELRPQVLDDNGLNAALNELGRHVEGVAVEVTTDVPDDLGNEYSITIFRIVQEALTNIQKHAHASEATVQVQIVDRAVEIEIRDNGIGYEGAVSGPSSAGSHLGLLGMRERARMLGGRFSISGRSGGGTVIRSRLPLAGDVDDDLDRPAAVDPPVGEIDH